MTTKEVNQKAQIPPSHKKGVGMRHQGSPRKEGPDPRLSLRAGKARVGSKVRAQTCPGELYLRRDKEHQSLKEGVLQKNIIEEVESPTCTGPRGLIIIPGGFHYRIKSAKEEVQ